MDAETAVYHDRHLPDRLTELQVRFQELRAPGDWQILVREAAAEIEKLQGQLDRVGAALTMMHVGRGTRDESTFTRDEFYAAHGQDTIIELVEEALRGD